MQNQGNIHAKQHNMLQQKFQQDMKLSAIWNSFSASIWSLSKYFNPPTCKWTLLQNVILPHGICAHGIPITWQTNHTLQQCKKLQPTESVSLLHFLFLQAVIYPGFKLSIKTSNFHIQQNGNKAGNYANCYETSCKLEEDFCNRGSQQLMKPFSNQTNCNFHFSGLC